jgi:hypothetical protein
VCRARWRSPRSTSKSCARGSKARPPSYAGTGPSAHHARAMLPYRRLTCSRSVRVSRASADRRPWAAGRCASSRPRAPRGSHGRSSAGSARRRPRRGVPRSTDRRGRDRHRRRRPRSASGGFRPPIDEVVSATASIRDNSVDGRAPQSMHGSRRARSRAARDSERSACGRCTRCSARPVSSCGAFTRRRRRSSSPRPCSPTELRHGLAHDEVDHVRHVPTSLDVVVGHRGADGRCSCRCVGTVTVGSCGRVHIDTERRS